MIFRISQYFFDVCPEFSSLKIEEEWHVTIMVIIFIFIQREREREKRKKCVNEEASNLMGVLH